HGRPDGGAHRAALDPSAVFKPQALGPGRLPRTAEGQPPALPRRVRLPLQSAPNTACRVRYTARYRRAHRPSSLPRADPQDCPANLAPNEPQHVELPDARAEAFVWDPVLFKRIEFCDADDETFVFDIFCGQSAKLFLDAAALYRCMSEQF